MKFNRDSAPGLSAALRSGRSVLLLGPRQTGKSTLFKDMLADFPRRLEYPLQLPSVRARLERDPETVVREAAGLPGSGRVLVFVDEIQKAPALMDVLQYLLDEKRIVLAATGSSARKLRRAAVNWLPGRILLERLYPLTWNERGLSAPRGPRPGAFEEGLLYGCLPGMLAEPNLERRREQLASYTALYLDEEIRAEAVVRRLQPFSRFLPLAAMESGTSPNYSRLASQVGVSHTAVYGYYQILEDSLIAHRLGAYGKSRAATLRKARYYFFDLGVRNAAAELGHDRGLLSLQMGPLFEHHVVLEAVARCGGKGLSYWRTKDGDEVDLVVERGGRTMAIEIKATDKPRPEDFRGLAAFRKAEKCDEAFLLCRAPRAQRFEHGTALPWWELPL